MTSVELCHAQYEVLETSWEKDYLKHPVEYFDGRVWMVGGEDPHKYNSRSYLVCGDSHKMMIDPGAPEGLDLLTANLEKIDLGWKNIDAIMGTHCHRDHINAVAELRKRGVYIPFGLHPANRDAVEVDYPNEINAAYMYEKKFEPLRIDFHLEDGEEFDLGSASLKIIHTPGHTADSCCFLLNTGKDLVAFGGDTIWGNCSKDLHSGIQSDPNLWLQSLQKLNAYKGTALFAGHIPEQYACQSWNSLERSVPKFRTRIDEMNQGFADMLNPWE